MTAFATLSCPVCRGVLTESPQTLSCPPCARDFPVVAGIPDLRLAPDPWIGLEDDRAKALRVLEVAEGRDFEGHVRAYWSLTPETPAPHAERFVQHVLRAAQRSREWLALAAPDPDGGPWLDLGCGTADLAQAAAPVPVFGVDIAMRWLVIARVRLVERGITPRLVCANAEALPFADSTFSRVLALGTLEHCDHPAPVLREAGRVLAAGGRCRVRTTNRFSLLPEPHVGLWGVGFLPRRWADAYVRLRGGRGYAHHRPPSRRELEREMRRAGFTEIRVGAAPALETEVAASGAVVRRTAGLYESMRRTPVVGRSLAAVAPLLEGTCTRGAARHDG